MGVTFVANTADGGKYFHREDIKKMEITLTTTIVVGLVWNSLWCLKILWVTSSQVMGVGFVTYIADGGWSVYGL